MARSLVIFFLCLNGACDHWGGLRRQIDFYGNIEDDCFLNAISSSNKVRLKERQKESWLARQSTTISKTYYFRLLDLPKKKNLATLAVLGKNVRADGTREFTLSFGDLGNGPPPEDQKIAAIVFQELESLIIKKCRGMVIRRSP